LGGKYFQASFNLLRRGGSLVTFGSTSYVNPGLGINAARLLWRYWNRPKIDPGLLTARNVRIAGFNLIYLTDRPQRLRRELKDCILCLSGKDVGSSHGNDDSAGLSFVTPPVVGEVFDFRNETIDAMECLKSGQTYGKVVLSNEHNQAA
jgi:hypothetical protein